MYTQAIYSSQHHSHIGVRQLDAASRKRGLFPCRGPSPLVTVANIYMNMQELYLVSVGEALRRW